MTFRRVLWLLHTAFWLTLFGVCVFAFYERYWQWRDCFSDLGRCYDPVGEQVLVEGAGFVWSTLALVCASMATLSWLWFGRHGRPTTRR